MDKNYTFKFEHYLLTTENKYQQIQKLMPIKDVYSSKSTTKMAFIWIFTLF